MKIRAKFKPLITALLILSVLISPLLTSWEVSAASYIVKVSATSLNVRSGAGTGRSIVGVAYKNSEYAYLGEAKDAAGTVWYKIQFGSKTGYITSQYASKLSGGESSSAVSYVVSITGGTVNVRAGAGTGNSVIGTSKMGEKYSYLGEAKDTAGTVWYKIQFGAKTGYVTSQYAKKSQGTTTTPTTTTAATTTTTTTAKTTAPSSSASYVVSITGGTVNVRAGAGTGNSVIGTSKMGEKYSYLGETKDTAGTVWYKIQFGAKTGYVTSQYAKKSQGTATTTTTAATTTTTTTKTTAADKDKSYVVSVTGSAVNVRAGAGTGQSILGSARKGEEYSYLGEAKDAAGTVWYIIRFAGKNGYITSAYSVKKEGTVAETPQPDPDAIVYIKQVYATESLVNVRTGAGTANGVYGTIKQGILYDYLSETTVDGTVWYELRFGAGKAWVSSAYSAIKSIKAYKKSANVKLSTHFSTDDFDCQGSDCCTVTKIDDELVEKLEKLWEYVGSPVAVTGSGYRCPTHNAAVDGASSDSNHTRGIAADITISGITPEEAAQAAIEVGFTGIIRYPGKQFNHVDLRSTTQYMIYSGGSYQMVSSFN